MRKVELKVLTALRRDSWSPKEERSTEDHFLNFGFGFIGPIPGSSHGDDIDLVTRNTAVQCSLRRHCQAILVGQPCLALHRGSEFGAVNAKKSLTPEEKAGTTNASPGTP